MIIKHCVQLQKRALVKLRRLKRNRSSCKQKILKAKITYLAAAKWLEHKAEDENNNISAKRIVSEIMPDSDIAVKNSWESFLKTKGFLADSKYKFANESN